MKTNNTYTEIMKTNNTYTEIMKTNNTYTKMMKTSNTYTKNDENKQHKYKNDENQQHTYKNDENQQHWPWTCPMRTRHGHLPLSAGSWVGRSDPESRHGTLCNKQHFHMYIMVGWKERSRISTQYSLQQTTFSHVHNGLWTGTELLSMWLYKFLQICKDGFIALISETNNKLEPETMCRSLL